ncbi:hypothetical protein FRC06_006638, partial [Ceratobasidium sp. 370]
MPTGTHKAVRDHIHATTAANHSKTHTPTPEPTTSSGITRGNALLNTPLGGSEHPRLTSGRRPSRPSKLGALYKTSRRKSREHGELSQRGKQCKAAERAYSQSQGRKSNGDGTDAQTDIEELQTHVDDAQTDFDNAQTDFDGVETDANDAQTDTGDTQLEAPAPARCGRKKSVTLAKPKPRRRSPTTRKGNLNRPPTHSPTPGSTDLDPADLDFVTGNTPAGLQYTYVYETVDCDTLIRIVEKKLGADNDARLRDRSTQDILVMLQIHEADQSLLPLAPIGVGGGWHGNHPAITAPAASGSNPAEPRPAKRASDASDDQTNKQARIDPVENTDTEPESDEEVARPPVVRTVSAQPHTETHPCSDPLPLQPQLSTSPLPPPPTRAPTPTTIPESQPSAQLLLSHVGLPIPHLPKLHSPPHGLAHTCLQAMLLRRLTDSIESDEETDKPDKLDKPDEEYDTSNRTRRDPTTPIRNSKNKAIYGKAQSHMRSDPESLAASAALPTEPNSPTTSDPVLIEIEHTHTPLEKACAAADSRSRIPHCSSATQPLQSRVARSLIDAATHPDPPAPHRRREKENRRLDPISAARADMVAFNDEVTQGNPESFVRSVTRQSKRPRNERTSGSAPICHHRSMNDLLDDNEAELAQVQALEKGRAPVPSSSRRRHHNCKKKPLARDFSGLRHQVLILAKLHLFAFALAEGIYQTQLTFMEWAVEIHYVTWTMLLPNIPYEAATQEELEVMFNHLATLGGNTQQDIQDNLDTFNLVHPNSFHCTTYSPRDGHYKNPDIVHCIAAAFFYAPSMVGLQFPDYFDEMPLTIVAFILAIWQFCLKEWSNGYFEGRDLGTSHMLDKYEAHLAGLKALRDIAPDRLNDLQTEWHDYTKSYAGALFVHTHHGQAVTLHSELRPDTPRPEHECRCGRANAKRGVDHDELDSQLTQTAQLVSLEQLGMLNEANSHARTQTGNDLRAETPNISHLHPLTPP